MLGLTEAVRFADWIGLTKAVQIADRMIDGVSEGEMDDHSPWLLLVFFLPCQLV
jgi:hypothetical protein